MLKLASSLLMKPHRMISEKHQIISFYFNTKSKFYFTDVGRFRSSIFYIGSSIFYCLLNVHYLNCFPLLEAVVILNRVVQWLNHNLFLIYWWCILVFRLWIRCLLRKLLGQFKRAFIFLLVKFRAMIMGILYCQFVLPGYMLQLFEEMSIILSHSCLFCCFNEHCPHNSSCLHRIEDMNYKHRRSQQTRTKLPSLAIRFAAYFPVTMIDHNVNDYLLYDVVKHQQSKKLDEATCLCSKVY